MTEKATSRKDGTHFRDILHRGNYKYKAHEFTQEPVGVRPINTKKKTPFNPWSTQAFNSELDKAFPVQQKWTNE